MPTSAISSNRSSRAAYCEVSRPPLAAWFGPTCQVGVGRKVLANFHRNAIILHTIDTRRRLHTKPKPPYHRTLHDETQLRDIDTFCF